MKIDGIDLSDLSKFPTMITVGELKKLREKAEKWDRVKGIVQAGHNDCEDCPAINVDCQVGWDNEKNASIMFCDSLKDVVDALEGEVEGE